MAGLTRSQLLYRACNASSSTGLLPYLVPAFCVQCPAPNAGAPRVQFSTTAPLQKRKKRPRKDNNPNRALSAFRGTGLSPRKTLSVRNQPLPEPVLDPKKRASYEPDPDHGLWGFFNKEQTLLTSPETESAHGRHWTIWELRRKDWDDLHRLWWVCAKERNRIATEREEHKRIQPGYGEHEANERDSTVKKTMHNIRTTLIERWNGYREARRLALQDPDVKKVRRSHHNPGEFGFEYDAGWQTIGYGDPNEEEEAPEDHHEDEKDLEELARDRPNVEEEPPKQRSRIDASVGVMSPKPAARLTNV